MQDAWNCSQSLKFPVVLTMQSVRGSEAWQKHSATGYTSPRTGIPGLYKSWLRGTMWENKLIFQLQENWAKVSSKGSCGSPASFSYPKCSHSGLFFSCFVAQKVVHFNMHRGTVIQYSTVQYLVVHYGIALRVWDCHSCFPQWQTDLVECADFLLTFDVVFIVCKHLEPATQTQRCDGWGVRH